MKLVQRLKRLKNKRWYVVGLCIALNGMILYYLLSEILQMLRILVALSYYSLGI